MSDLTVSAEEVGGLTIRVEYEESYDFANPRDWTNLGVMVCSHLRYNLGDVQAPSPDDYFGVYGYGSIRNWLIAEHDAIAETIMPLYLMDHSGLSMSTDASGFRAFDSAGWDWGIVGFTFATPATIAETGCSGEHWPPERIREGLAQEVETYDHYLRGDVFAYVITDAEGNVLDSCGGFLGDPDYALSEARESVEYLPEYRRAVVGAFAGSEGLGL
jgi:hypothetical protein